MAKAVIAIAGSSGLIGSALVAALRAADHRVMRIVRRTPANSGEVHWNPESGEFDATALNGVDAVVNLCGINIGQRRWSGAFKQNLRDSRITPTEVLAAAVSEAGVGVLVNASAVGYYGNTRDRQVDETASAGNGFLAQLCQDWEAATAPAQQGGVRVVLARTGLVLAPSGGVLGRMRPLFSLGLGARLGTGRQYISWISLEDEVRALQFAISHDALRGPVNLTGPAPVTNAEFTAALGRAVRRPTPLVLPGFAVRAALGELADELLCGQRAIPAVLERAGFRFQHNTIGEALRYATSRPAVA
ncbi:TIGR01777 family protein [Mycobacterium heckeshornense]|uniref:Epimerase family protein n=1 Tax=Mycobacterium heckeshornense TaxID=110505 RepID=A0A2G8B0Y8_9MYCO|nr:TIGR01777 family oxidoreductase [Mycobacterium heckeshornense]KMV21576.1 multidrug MFS transporter [Mycobacterium heckeshornense]MCV7032910.1 TIGR01777 family protein [Mycobacterium heckeshornense]PIJ31431.1 TIGR01777 family protein [Mycobacterium heckeshornense]BCO35558.1 epimerase family protein [Mycobacterium heckeshornense]BCQ08695.1 nucleoside-diphosphate sugar epimerase [Mycobacterium heckeshornense]